MPGLSLGPSTILRVVSNEVLVQREQEQYQRDLESKQQSELVTGMSAYLKTCFDAARRAKLPIEQTMLESLRQRNGEYEPTKAVEISKHGGSAIYMMLTEVKCRAAESWLRDILMDAGSPPWSIEPTAVPELSPDRQAELQRAVEDRMMELLAATGNAPEPSQAAYLKEVVGQEFRFRMLQEAQARADGMKHKIEDQFQQGGWLEAFNDFITDLVTFPAAFVKGPIVRRQRMLEWAQEGGRTVPKATEKLGPEFERVDPFRLYPEPGISKINDGYMFEHHPMSRSDLSELIGVPGYDEQAIRKILELGCQQTSWVLNYAETQKQDLERKFNADQTPTAMFDVLEFWGKLSGKMLREWGMSPEQVPDEAREYDANVWLCGHYVIKAVLNFDPLGEKPYAKTSFIKTPGAFWGRGIPEVIRDLQSVCNASARALVNNMGIASGPQVEVNTERLPTNEDITALYPWKIWQVLNDPSGQNVPALRFFQPDDRSGQLMAVYDRFSRLADDHSGIPSYVHGDTDVKGAGRTASGLSMLMGSAGKGIRQIVMHIDADIIKVIVGRQYVFNMRYDEDESIKGDVQIVPKGAVNLAVKETVNMRRIEFLNATMNPFDAEIMGKTGRAAVLREVAKSLQMPEDDVVPSREKAAIMQRVEGASTPAEGQPGGQAALPNPKTQELDGSVAGGRDSNLVS